MNLLDFPDEILIKLVGSTFEAEGLRAGLRLRLVCSKLNEIGQDALFHYPLFLIGRERISKDMTLKLIRTKLERQNADRSSFCLTVNATVSYLTSDPNPDSPHRKQYVDALVEAALGSMFHWHLCKHLSVGQTTTHGNLKDNALVAAIMTNEQHTVKKLLESGANLMAKTPFFGEPFAAAASMGSLEMMQFLFQYQNWYFADYFVQVRYIHAIEAAAKAGHGEIVQALRDLPTCAPRYYSFENAIVAAIRAGHDAVAISLMPVYTDTHFSRTVSNIWDVVLRTAAECGSQRIMKHLTETGVITRISKETFGHTLELACRNNQDAIVAHLLHEVEPQEAQYYTNSLFWAAYLGNHANIDLILEALIPSRQVIARALSGAVSGQQLGTVSYLLSLVGISISHLNPPPRTFTDLIHILYPEMPSPRADRLGPGENVFRYFFAFTNPDGCLPDFLEQYCNFRPVLPGDHRRLGEQMFWAAVVNVQPDVALYILENNYFVDRYLDRAEARGPRSMTESTPAYQMALNHGFELCNSAQLMGECKSEHLLHFVASRADRDIIWSDNIENYIAACFAVFAAPMRMVRFILKTYPNITQGKFMSLAICNADSSLERIELLLDLGYPIDKSASICYPLRNDPAGLVRKGTPLECAIERDHPDIVKYLLNRGADPTLVTARGRNALEFAQMKGNVYIIALVAQATVNRMMGGLHRGRRPIWPSSAMGLSLLYLPRPSFRNVLFHRPDYLYGIRPRY